MYRRFVVAVAIVTVAVSFAFSETLTGQIVGFKDGKVSFKAKVDGKVGDAKDYPLAESVKLYKKGMKGQPGELDVEGKAKVADSVFLKGVADKGKNAKIEVIDGKVTEIRPGGGKKGA